MFFESKKCKLSVKIGYRLKLEFLTLFFVISTYVVIFEFFLKITQLLSFLNEISFQQAVSCKIRSSIIRVKNFFLFGAIWAYSASEQLKMVARSLNNSTG